MYNGSDSNTSTVATVNHQLNPVIGPRLQLLFLFGTPTQMACHIIHTNSAIGERGAGEHAVAGVAELRHAGPQGGVAVQQLEDVHAEHTQARFVRGREAEPLPRHQLLVHALDLIHHLLNAVTGRQCVQMLTKRLHAWFLQVCVRM